jgi:uncharacterized protein YneF (UPF0154 family)
MIVRPLYASIVAVIAAPIEILGAHSLGAKILVVLVLMVALAAAGHFLGRRYVSSRLHRHALDELPPIDELGGAIRTRLSRATARWSGPVR